MAEETEQQQNEETSETEKGAKGTPSEEQKTKRLEQQIEELKKQLEESKQQVTNLNESLSKALSEDDVKAAVEKAQKEAEEISKKAESDAKAREKRLVVENELIKAKCIDTTSALAHIDLEKVEVASDGHISGLDVAALANSHKHLFQEANTANMKSAGDPSGSGTMTKEEIMAIKNGTKRRKAIEENIELFETQEKD